MSTERNSKRCKEKNIKFRMKSQIHDFAHLSPVRAYGFSHPMRVQMP